MSLTNPCNKCYNAFLKMHVSYHIDKRTSFKNLTLYVVAGPGISKSEGSVPVFGSRYYFDASSHIILSYVSGVKVIAIAILLTLHVEYNSSLCSPAVMYMIICILLYGDHYPENVVTVYVDAISFLRRNNYSWHIEQVLNQ